MSDSPVEASYLDAIFSGIRAFTQKLQTSQEWLTRAEVTSDRAWRLSFLREARRAYESARPYMNELADRLGPPDRNHARALDDTSPLDQLQQSIAMMRANFDTHERKLLALESNLALALGHVGTA